MADAGSDDGATVDPRRGDTVVSGLFFGCGVATGFACAMLVMTLYLAYRRQRLRSNAVMGVPCVEVIGTPETV